MYLELLTSKLRLVRPGVFSHWCPACMASHDLVINSAQADGQRLGFDGDLSCPTFEPFIERREGNRICKYLIRAGRLVYSPDCTHALAGQTFELPHFPLS